MFSFFFYSEPVIREYAHVTRIHPAPSPHGIPVILDDPKLEHFSRHRLRLRNPEHHGKLKHVERRHFYIREAIEAHRLCAFRTQ